MGTIPAGQAIHLDPTVAVLAEGLKMLPDPADRFIVASAIARNARLVTKDRLIRKLKLVTTVW